MTGSSGAAAVHVLLGINDAGIGTDGGGSVLAPALSLNLCSVMAKGIGLAGSGLRQSTEGISFFPGIGVISHSLKLAIEAILIVAELETSVLQAVSLDGLKLAVPASGAITLPDGSDMCDRLGPALRLARECGLQIVEIDLPDCKNRAEAIARLENIFSEHELIMTFEGPVDFYGLGDSVFGGWGPNATKSQSISGKYMVKIANMVNSTAVTIPAGDAACGLVVLARQGRKSGLAAMALGEKLSAAFPPPKLFDNYFRRGWERQKNDLLFSLEEYK
jgi:Asp-tRNA(Asn)/Glu-tRNA(Gln) amidotransferase A subunit family amidase